MRRWPATNVFVDDYRALRVMNFARFDLVKGKKKKKKRENKTNFPSFDREMEKRGTENGENRWNRAKRK